MFSARSNQLELNNPGFIAINAAQPQSTALGANLGYAAQPQSTASGANPELWLSQPAATTSDERPGVLPKLSEFHTPDRSFDTKAILFGARHRSPALSITSSKVCDDTRKVILAS